MMDKKLEIPQTPVPKSIIDSETREREIDAKLDKHNRAVNRLKRLLGQNEMELPILKGSLPRMQADFELGLIDASVVQKLRKQIEFSERVKKENPAVIAEFERRMDPLKDVKVKEQRFRKKHPEYVEAKKYVANKNGHKGAGFYHQYYRQLDYLAKDLGLEEDLHNFFKWLRTVKSASWWDPFDKRGLDPEGG